MSKIAEVRELITGIAEEFGAKNDNEFNQSYIERNNTGVEALKDNGAYFGFIHPEEENSGPFHDFSLTIFPNEQEQPWLVCLGIGSSGFKNDYELATYPGLRRLFSRLIDEKGFAKSDFSDIETSLPRGFTSRDELKHIKNTIKTYSKVLPACQIVEDPLSETGVETIAAFVAGYAKLRDWPTNAGHRSAISKALATFLEEEPVDEIKEIQDLVNERKYVVLQGPPGTGKTRAAKMIAENTDAKTFFTQFHAETSYSDFIYGLQPRINEEALAYEESIGVFSQALEYAIANDEEEVLLIIDEINRANLSNVLGPIFYLFEPKMDDSTVEIQITPNLKVNRIPENFRVIATMNTADRSLAVVDFALRRRFAWYNLAPKAIDADSFYAEDFTKIKEIFEWFANGSELNLQPGQGYFLAASDEEIKNRIRYEILPLIKEYLEEGLLRTAKEEFNNYFASRVEETIFE